MGPCLQITKLFLNYFMVFPRGRQIVDACGVTSGKTCTSFYMQSLYLRCSLKYIISLLSWATKFKYMPSTLYSWTMRYTIMLTLIYCNLENIFSDGIRTIQDNGQRSRLYLYRSESYQTTHNFTSYCKAPLYLQCFLPSSSPSIVYFSSDFESSTNQPMDILSVCILTIGQTELVLMEFVWNKSN